MDALPPPCAADVPAPHSLAVERAIPRDSARAAAAVLGGHMRELAERGDRAGTDLLQPAMTLLWCISQHGMMGALSRLGMVRRAQVVLTPDLAEALRQAKAAGLSDVEAAMQLGVGRDTVQVWRRALGLPANNIKGRRRLLPPDAELLRMRKLGRSVADIAATYGVTKMAVYVGLQRARRASAAAAQEGAP